MTDDSKKQDVLLETTDCLEAIGTLKSNKNFFFFICLFCLILLQGCFWLMATKHVDIGTEGPSIEKSTVLVAVQQQTPAEASSDKIEKVTQTVVGEPNVAKSDPNAVWQKYAGQLAETEIKFSQLVWVIRICNYLLIICSIMYSLTLLFGLMISLVGRLGGISHVTRAFFTSLLIIIILLPWQIIFKSVCISPIYTPSELLASWKAYPDADVIAKTVMFLRYAGLAAVIFILLIWAQLKSMRWARNTLKRLGIVG